MKMTYWRILAISLSVAAPAAWADDQSLEDWLGKLAPEFLEYAIEPCYSFYCGWEPEETGRGTLVYMTVSYRQTASFTFKQGLGQLARALAARRVYPPALSTGVFIVCGKPR